MYRFQNDISINSIIYYIFCFTSLILQLIFMFVNLFLVKKNTLILNFKGNLYYKIESSCSFEKWGSNVNNSQDLKIIEKSKNKLVRNGIFIIFFFYYSKINKCRNLNLSQYIYISLF